MLFNPEEYTLNRDINYAQAAIPGLSAPILQFVNGNMQTLRDGAVPRLLRGARSAARPSTPRSRTCACCHARSPT